MAKHTDALVRFPLFCNYRLSREVKAASASQPAADEYVGHVIEEMEPVDLKPEGAPNAAYNEILAALNQCPAHGEGIVFSTLCEAKPSAHYSFEINFCNKPGPPTKGRTIAALVGVKNRSTQDTVGSGFKVTTSQVVLGWAGGACNNKCVHV